MLAVHLIQSSYLCMSTVSLPTWEVVDLQDLLECRLKTENGGSSRAGAPEADERREGSTNVDPGMQSTSSQREVPAEELKALRDVGFEAEGTRHIISHANLQ